MRLRNLLEKEILIRLTENGFVETIRRFGLERSLAHEMDESESTEEAATDERLISRACGRGAMRRMFNENSRSIGLHRCRSDWSAMSVSEDTLRKVIFVVVALPIGSKVRSFSSAMMPPA